MVQYMSNIIPSLLCLDSDCVTHWCMHLLWQKTHLPLRVITKVFTDVTGSSVGWNIQFSVTLHPAPIVVTFPYKHELVLACCFVQYCYKSRSEKLLHALKILPDFYYSYVVLEVVVKQPLRQCFGNLEMTSAWCWPLRALENATQPSCLLDDSL
jgi:hypothetical protein